MKNSLKKICCWFGVVVTVFGGILGCAIGPSVALASPIRQTVKNGDGYIVVEDTTRNNPEVTIEIEKDDGNSNIGETIKIQPSNSNVSELDDGNSGTTGNSGNSLDNLDLDKYLEEHGYASGGNNTNNDENNYGPEYTCDAIADDGVDGKVGAMQWIMCPMMDNTRYTATFLDNKIQDWLEIKTDIYSGKTVETVWGYIRNMANVVMIVLLMLIILSQLTGYGIDNYGIKKMLPRLIVMAIVINLSLYICQLAVDLSNIAGSGLRDMFGSIAKGVAGGEDVGGGGFIGSAVLAMFATGGTAAAAISTTATVASVVGISVTAFWAILIVVLLIVLVIIVAALVLLGLVGIRKILVMFCVIISPLAFVMFIFPNTQNLSKKWWNLFKTALVIYPICGAVAGISALLIAMAQNTDSLNWYEIAIVLVLPYLVYFLVPMLIKEAISALGKLGGALTSMGTAIKSGGKALGGAALRGAQNSEWGKNNIREAHRKTVMRRNNTLNDRLKRAQERAASGDPRAQRRLERMQSGARGRMYARAAESAEALEREDIKSSEVLLNRQYSDKSLNDLIKMSEEAANVGNFDRMVALHNVAFSRNGGGGAKAIAESIGKMNFFTDDGKGFIGGDDGEIARKFNAIRNNLMQNGALGNSMASKAPDVYQMVSNGGYLPSSNDNLRGNLDAHVRDNQMMTKDTDIASAGSNTIRRALAADTIDSETITRILNTTDPAMLHGLLSEKGKAEMFMAKAMNPNVDLNNTDAINRLADQWKAQNPSWNNQAQKAREANDAVISAANAMKDAARSMTNNIPKPNSNNGGQTFSGGAGI